VVITTDFNQPSYIFPRAAATVHKRFRQGKIERQRYSYSLVLMLHRTLIFQSSLATAPHFIHPILPRDISFQAFHRLQVIDTNCLGETIPSYPNILLSSLRGRHFLRSHVCKLCRTDLASQHCGGKKRIVFVFEV
jgi:hypothetical protein